MRACSTWPARPCPTWSNAETFAGIAEAIAVHASAAGSACRRRGEFAGRAELLLYRARSGFTGQALPAFFGPLELLQYLRRHLPMSFLIGMHVERVPVAVVQIDRDREHVCRRRLAA